MKRFSHSRAFVRRVCCFALLATFVSCSRGTASLTSAVPSPSPVSMGVPKPQLSHAKQSGATESRQSGDPFAAFAGKWTAHEVLLTILSDGQGELVWRLYNACGRDPAPCDDLKGNEIAPGGRATLVLRSKAGAIASGRVLTTNAPSDIREGPLVARLERRRDVLHLAVVPTREVPDGKLIFCGPEAPIDAC